MNARVWFFAALIPLLLESTALAEDRRPLREARSENGRFQLRIDPGRRSERSSRRARATLFARGTEKARGRTVWRARLANDVAPGYAFPRNDGRFVVTLDEFGRGGAAHAVVTYDHRGKPLREFSLRELLRGDDWKQVKLKRRAIEWLPGAEFTFVDSPPQFVIKLKWQREIRIDLERLQIVGQETKGAQGNTDSHAAIPPEILALLETPTSAPADQTDLSHQDAVAKTHEAREALQQIADLLGLSSDSVDAVEAAGAATLVVDPDSAGADNVAASTAGESTPDAASTGSTAGEESETSQPVFAGRSAEAGWGVPMPDPAHPADYLGWLMDYTVTDGPSAVPLYEAAFEQRREFEGDREVLDAAMRGDPEALASPEIAAYIEMNRDALASFHAAPQYEYRGILDPGDSGMIVGVMLPSLADTRDLAKMSVLQAKYLEANGDLDGAVDSYLSTLAVGAQISNDPTLIGNLVGIAIQSLSARSLLDSLSAHGDGDLDYQQLAQGLESKYQPLRPMVEPFQGERACGLDIIQRLYEWDPDTRQYQVSDEGLESVRGLFEDYSPESGIPSMAEIRSSLETLGFKNMVAEANQIYDRLTETALMPYQEAQQGLNDLEASVGSPEFRQRLPLMSALLPSLGRASHLSTRASATRNATRLVANLKAYRQQHGTYPDSLDAFGDSEMIRDPFTGGRFVYRPGGDDFTLYSLGGNGVDDGGVHDRRADTNDVLYWPRPPRED